MTISNWQELERRRSVWERLSPRHKLRDRIKPPRMIQHALDRQHRGVRLYFDDVLRVWTLWERVGMQWHSIRMICDDLGGYVQPTFENTVRDLNRAKQIVNFEDAGRYIDEIDKDWNDLVREEQRKASDQIRDRAGDHWNALVNRVVIQRGATL